MTLMPPQGSLDGATHRYPLRVYYEDTDAGGVVYHARYLHFFERARTEMLRGIGMSHSELSKTFNVLIIVRSLEVDYQRPAYLDDALCVETRLTDIGGASIKMSQLIRVLDKSGDEAICAHMLLRLACINGKARPARLPSEFLQVTRRFLE